jgi:hypothetical protein
MLIASKMVSDVAVVVVRALELCMRARAGRGGGQGQCTGQRLLPVGVARLRRADRGVEA